jgi:hypothetical protein
LRQFKKNRKDKEKENKKRVVVKNYTSALAVTHAIRLLLLMQDGFKVANISLQNWL